MLKKKIYRQISVILVLSMFTVLSGCGQNQSTNTKKADATVQLDVFSTSTASTTAAGVYDNTWWGKILKEKVGVSLNILPMDFFISSILLESSFIY